jgi:tetratricopeptide (TPR) repeat protein
MNRQVMREARSILDANSNLGATARIRIAAEQRIHTAILSLAEALRNDGKPDEALRELDPLWKAIESNWNVDVRIRIKTLNNRGLARIDAAKMPDEQSYDASKSDPGLQDLRDTLALASDQLGKDQVETIDAGVNLASQLWRVRGKRAAEETLTLRPLLEASKSKGASAARGRAALAIALARAFRSVGDEPNATSCISEAMQIVSGVETSQWTTDLLGEIASYHEALGDLREAIAMRQRLAQEARPQGSDPAGTRRFVDASSDLAYSWLWSGNLRQAVEVLQEALRFADRAELEGGLALASDARWNATNLLALALQRSGERNLGQIDGRIAQLREARERHNATVTNKSGAKAKRITWDERPDPRSRGN